MNTRRILSLSLIGLVLNLFFLHTTAAAGSKGEKLAAKVKAGIAKLGTGKESLVKVKLRDKTKISGYVSEITEDDFTVVQANNSATKIPYSQVKQVQGNNLSKNAKIIIGVVVVFLVLGIAFALAYP